MEEPVSSWLKVHIVYNNSIKLVPADPELILNCLEEYCLKEYYNTYVKELVGMNVGDMKVELYQLKGGVVVAYNLRSQHRVYLVVHRRDIDPLSLVKSIEQ